eukprot:CAMPEP_0117675384 /NCGR_PEP_ID=MMETSP0804-20121206/15575_1 /TAXON_ID=1074897 /ORGANISM="Tetraselmis astigmatica, Strain CCMP880" /LENGTH=789 /DNA_ID=CAMNT_0005484381 /DNA_START=254 /DNA_END=2623 /DNA_ORIENTATION=+
MQLSGPLPPSFKQFERMADLYLEGNQFSGTVPAVWSTVGILNRNIDVRLNDNALTGPLPLSWSSHPTLKNLEFSSNKLASSLPPEWSAMGALSTLELQSNQVTGPIPPQWSAIVGLEKLVVASNNITGPLPPELSVSGNLEELSLSTNSISGTLPPQWSTLSRLEELAVADNKITGTVPAEWSSIHQFRDLDLSGNLLTGTIPPEIVAMGSAVPPLVVDFSLNDMEAGNFSYPDTWVFEPQLGGLTEVERTPGPVSGNSPPSSSQGPTTRAVIMSVTAAVVVLLLLAAVVYTVFRLCCCRRSPPKGVGYLEAGSMSNVDRWLKTSQTDSSLADMSTQQYREHVRFDEVSQAIVNLHELMPDAYKTLPMRLLQIDFVLKCSLLPSYDELNDLDEGARQGVFYDIPYSSADDELWNAIVVVSWRWSHPKPDRLECGFCPMSCLQLKQLQRSLGNTPEDAGIQYVWVDWCCVPQYCASPMAEIARSKVYYGRARAMKIVPGAEPLPEGSLRVVLSNAIRTLQQAEQNAAHPLHARHSLIDISLAAMSLKQMKDSGVLFKREYFGRVWTLAERMCRHGRNERLQHWMPLDVWLSMTLDALWASSEASSVSAGQQGSPPSWLQDFYWDKLYGPNAARAGIDALAAIRESGSHLVSESVDSEVASLFVAAVEGWRTRQVTEEVNVQWLRQYLCSDAGAIYQSWDPRDALWAIFSFFCWHIRTPAEFSAALTDLCRVAGICESETKLQALADTAMEPRAGSPPPEESCNTCASAAAAAPAGEDKLAGDGWTAIPMM